jgi:hypothetical protein
MGNYCSCQNRKRVVVSASFSSRLLAPQSGNQILDGQPLPISGRLDGTCGRDLSLLISNNSLLNLQRLVSPSIYNSLSSDLPRLYSILFCLFKFIRLEVRAGGLERRAGESELDGVSAGVQSRECELVVLSLGKSY